MGLDAIEPVVIKFAIRGVPDAERAFLRIAKSANDAEHASASGAMNAADQRVRSTRREANDREKMYATMFRDIERQEKKAASDKDKFAQEEWRAAKKGLDLRVRESEKAHQQMLRLEQATERAHEAQNRRDEQAAKKRADAEIREATRAAHAVDTVQRRFGRHVGGAFVNSTSSILGGAKMIAGAAMGIGGGFAIADIVRGRAAAEQQAALLVNTVTTGNTAPAGANVKDILRQAAEVSVATGMSKEELVGGTLEYARKARGGDFKGAMANMSFFAKMATATGAGINDIAAAAGTLQSQNADLSPADMQQMLLNVYAQGKVGSMSMVDVAKQIGTLGSARSMFTGNVGHTQQVLMGLGQIAAPEGSVEEAGTYVKDFVAEASKHHDKLAGMGVKYTNGKMGSPEEMIEQVFRATKGNMGTIGDIFGLRGRQVFSGLSGSFDKGVAAGGIEGGIAAIHARMAEVTGATMTAGQLDSQVSQLIEQPGKRIERAFNALREKAEEKLAPALEQFAVNTLPRMIPYLEKGIDAMDHFARFMFDNPLAGIGGIIAAKVTADIGGAAVGFAVKEAITMALRGSMGGGVGGAASGAAGLGMIGGAAALAGVALVGVAGGAAIAITDENDKNSQRSGVGHMAEADALAGKIRRGEASESDIKRAKELQGQLTQDQAYFLTEANVGATGKFVDKVTGTNVSGDRAASMRKNAAGSSDSWNQLLQALLDNEMATKKLAEETAKNTEATKSNTKAPTTARAGAPGAHHAPHGPIDTRTPTPL